MYDYNIDNVSLLKSISSIINKISLLSVITVCRSAVIFRLQWYLFFDIKNYRACSHN